MVVVEGEGSQDQEDNMAVEEVDIVDCNQNGVVQWGHYHMQAAAQRVPPLVRICEHDNTNLHTIIIICITV